MSILINSKNRTLSVRVDGELDLVTAHEIREEIDRAMDEMLGQNLIVDLARVTFIDSSGLGVILGRYRKIKAKNGKMVLCALNPNVKRILELSGILSFIPVALTEGDARKMIEQKAFKGA